MTEVVSNVVHVLAILLALSIPLSLLDGTLFAWHPSLMAIGFLGLMTEGILTSIGFRSLDGNDRLKRVWVHLAWQATAVSFVTAGFWVIYANKVNHSKSHFTSLHGKFGLSTFLLALVAASGGAASFRRFGVVTKLPERLQPRLKWLHRNMSLAIWLLALVTVELALVHKAVWKGVLSQLWQVGVALLGSAVVLHAVWQRLGASHKLPVYHDESESAQFGVVNAADELNKTA